MADKNDNVVRIRGADGNPSRAGFKRKLLTVIIAFVAVVMALVAVAFVTCKVNNITVEGKIPYKTDEVLNIVSLVKGKSMFTLDTDEIVRTIESSLPYTDNVTVTKKFPRTIKISASTAKEVYAVMLSENFYAITTGNLKVLEAKNSVPENVIIVEGGTIATYELGKTLTFTGKNGDDKTKELLVSVNDAINECGIKDVNMINVYDINNIYFIYESRIVVKLGNSESIAKKMNLGKKTLDEENKQSTFQYGELDLSILKEAIFAPDDLKDLPELLDFLDRMEQSEEEAEESSEDNTEIDEKEVSQEEAGEAETQLTTQAVTDEELILHAD